MYLFAPFTMQNFKKILRVDPGNPIFSSKMAHLSHMRFFLRKTINNFHVVLGPFHCAKFQKNLQSRYKVMRVYHFLTTNGPFTPNKNIFKKNINAVSMQLMVFFIMQNFKSILSVDARLFECFAFRPKMAHLSQKRIFSVNQLVNLIAFIHDCLHVKNQSQMSIH